MELENFNNLILMIESPDSKDHELFIGMFNEDLKTQLNASEIYKLIQITENARVGGILLDYYMSNMSRLTPQEIILDIFKTCQNPFDKSWILPIFKSRVGGNWNWLKFENPNTDYFNWIVTDNNNLSAEGIITLNMEDFQLDENNPKDLEIWEKIKKTTGEDQKRKTMIQNQKSL